MYVLTGDDVLTAYTSPLLVDLLDAAVRQVRVSYENLSV